MYMFVVIYCVYVIETLFYFHQILPFQNIALGIFLTIFINSYLTKNLCIEFIGVNKAKSFLCKLLRFSKFS
jgi:hypothetical protein